MKRKYQRPQMETVNVDPQHMIATSGNYHSMSFDANQNANAEDLE